MDDATKTQEAMPAGEIVQRAAAVWGKAQVLYESPSWGGKPEARAMAEAIAFHHPECERPLIGLLDDENQLVVAYSLITLEMMGSDALQHLPEGLLDCRSNITLTSGSMRTGMDLGGLARQLRKRARERAPRQSVQTP